MLIMDGLELTKWVMALKKDIKVIILSAYAHFEYAQKAIAPGAFDYGFVNGLFSGDEQQDSSAVKRS